MQGLVVKSAVAARIEGDILDMLFQKWGLASGFAVCPLNSLNTREDIRAIARQGLLRAIREYDPSRKTKSGQPVNLKSWCIIVMRSYVNGQRYSQVWKKENTFFSEDNVGFCENYVDYIDARSVPNTDAVYDVLVQLVDHSLLKKSKELRVVFGLRVFCQVDTKEIAALLSKKVKDVEKMYLELKDIVLAYGKCLRISVV